MSITLQVNPKKLLNSKWTAVTPTNKEKHFLITKLIYPEQPVTPITHIELEVVNSARTQVLLWHELTIKTSWLQGWL
ncbi:MAG: tryptophan-rich hypothetical protein [Methylophilaceae bacterium]|jgi:tryptophan-rich hypothetical protein